MGMALTISSSLLGTIAAAAAAEAPHEACGLLFGTANAIEAMQLAANVAAEPRRHFEIDPAALFAALRAERAGGPALIGYWHSHPGGDARPSPTDTACAAPDGRIWLIVSAGESRAWRATRTGFEAAELTIVSQKPAEIAAISVHIGINLTDNM